MFHKGAGLLQSRRIRPLDKLCIAFTALQTKNKERHMRKDRKVNNDSIQVNYEDYPFIITVMLVILCGAYKLRDIFDSTVVQLPFDSTSI